MSSSAGTGITGLPAELLYHIFSFSGDEHILALGKTCRILNQFAIPIFLQRKGILDPATEHVLVRPYHNTRDDELAGLISDLSLTRMKHLTCKLYPRRDSEIVDGFDNTALSKSTMQGLAQNLKRVLLLVERLTEIESLHIHFYPTSGKWLLTSESLQEFLATLIEIANVALSKSCNDIVIFHPHAITADKAPCEFRQNKGFNLPNVVRRGLSGVGRSNQDEYGAPGEKWRFRELFEVKITGNLNPFPSTIQQSTCLLTSLDLSSDFLFVPPFSSWTFNILENAPIERLSLSFAWTAVISDEALRYYILPEILRRVPQLTELRIGFLSARLFNLSVEHLKYVPRLQKLSFALTKYGQYIDPFPGSKKSPAIPVPLPHLTSFTGSAWQAAWLLGGPISCPHLKHINIIDDSYHSAASKPRCMDIVEPLANINRSVVHIHPTPTISICVRHAFQRGPTDSPLVPEDLAHPLGAVSRLTLKLPIGTFEEVDEYVFACLEAFRNVTALTLISTQPSMRQRDLDAILAMIRDEFPNISALNIVEQPGKESHFHWSNKFEEFGQPEGASAIPSCVDFVCSHF